MKKKVVIVHSTKPFGTGFTKEFTDEDGKVRTRKYVPDVQEAIQKIKESGEEFPALTFPGAYPIYYITKDNGVLCSKCCNENRDAALDFENNDGGFSVVAMEINYEDPNLFCWHCNGRVEAAYV